MPKEWGVDNLPGFNGWFVFALLGVFLIGGIFRLSDLSTRGLEYDECWTLDHYVERNVGEIFSDLSTPNNHPLHSLLVKWSVQIWGCNSLGIRLPVFIAGLLLLPVVAAAGLLLFRSYWAALSAAVFCAGSGVLIHYSQTARGYELQSLFLTLFVFLVIWYEARRPEYGHWRMPVLILLVVMPLLAILTLPPSVLFIAAVAIVHLGHRLLAKQEDGKALTLAEVRRRLCNLFYHDRGIVIGYGFLALFCLGWYGLNYSKFTSGMEFGTRLDSLDRWGVFLGGLIGLVGWPLLLAPGLLLLDKSRRRLLLALAFMTAVPVLAAILSKAGPARVYSPLVPWFCIAGGGGVAILSRKLADRLRKQSVMLIMSLLLMCLVFGRAPDEIRSWTPIDWGRLAGEIRAEVSGGAYISYPALSCYEIRHYDFPENIIDNFHRLPQRETGFISAGSVNTISGIRYKDGNSVDLEIKCPGTVGVLDVAGHNCGVYRLIRISAESLSNSNVVLAAIPPASIPTAESAKNSILGPDPLHWVVLNDWLLGEFADDQMGKVKGYLLATDNCPLTFGQLQAIERKTSGAVRFYSLIGAQLPDVIGRREAQPGPLHR